MSIKDYRLKTSLINVHYSKESAKRVKKMRPASIGVFSIVYFYVLIIKQNQSCESPFSAF
jgi:hypothetical protein